MLIQIRFFYVALSFLFCITEEGMACGFVNLRTELPTLLFDVRYATSNNFLGEAVYSGPDCFLHRDAAEALKRVQEELKEIGYNLKVFDGYRPLHIQQRMWDLIQDERYVSNPAKNLGRHTRGTAIDLTIVDSEGNELEMPSDFDDFTEKAHHSFSDASEQAIKNRALLRDLMLKNGFEIFPCEWWHYDYHGWNDSMKYPALDFSFEEVLLQISQ